MRFIIIFGLLCVNALNARFILNSTKPLSIKKSKKVRKKLKLSSIENCLGHKKLIIEPNILESWSLKNIETANIHKLKLTLKDSCPSKISIFGKKLFRTVHKELSEESDWLQKIMVKCNPQKKALELILQPHSDVRIYSKTSNTKPRLYFKKLQTKDALLKYSLV